MTSDIHAAIDANPLWYHTMELAPGAVTPGWFDLRPVVDRMPWPNLGGMRCLDIGTYDGFLAFEMERRGAAEVVAADIASHEDWDWPPRARARGAEYLRTIAGEKGRGFEIAKEALGSSVQRVFVSIYDLTPDAVGRFDVVVCGDLLLHLRDPMRALAAVRGVCAGMFLSAEHVDGALTLTHPRRAVLHLNGEDGQWFIPNVAGHVRMLDVAGFDVIRRCRYAIPDGPAHPVRAITGREKVSAMRDRALVRGRGQATSAVLCRPITTADGR